MKSPMEEEIYVMRRFSTLRETYNLTGDCGRVCFVAEAAKVIAGISDIPSKNRWVREAAKLANISEDAMILSVCRELAERHHKIQKGGRA